jgi:hypothetical protein
LPISLLFGDLLLSLLFHFLRLPSCGWFETNRTPKFFVTTDALFSDGNLSVVVIAARILDVTKAFVKSTTDWDAATKLIGTPSTQQLRAAKLTDEKSAYASS